MQVQKQYAKGHFRAVVRGSGDRYRGHRRPTSPCTARVCVSRSLFCNMCLRVPLQVAHAQAIKALCRFWPPAHTLECSLWVHPSTWSQPAVQNNAGPHNALHECPNHSENCVEVGRNVGAMHKHTETTSHSGSRPTPNPYSAYEHSEMATHPRQPHILTLFHANRTLRGGCGSPVAYALRCSGASSLSWRCYRPLRLCPL